jgi:hypothetical protein
VLVRAGGVRADFGETAKVAESSGGPDGSTFNPEEVLIFSYPAR